MQTIHGTQGIKPIYGTPAPGSTTQYLLRRLDLLDRKQLGRRVCMCKDYRMSVMHVTGSTEAPVYWDFICEGCLALLQCIHKVIRM